MMELNKNNIEAWLLDYHEGNLSEEQELQLIDFLNTHPELKIDLGDLPSFNPEVISFLDKKALKHEAMKKKVAGEETLCVRWLENDLSPEEKTAFEKRMEAEPRMAQKALLYEHTRLQPDLSVTYPGKSRLKHRGLIAMRPSTVRWISAIAAVLLIGWFVLPVMQSGVAPLGPEQKTTYKMRNSQPVENSGEKNAASLPQLDHWVVETAELSDTQPVSSEGKPNRNLRETIPAKEAIRTPMEVLTASVAQLPDPVPRAVMQVREEPILAHEPEVPDFDLPASTRTLPPYLSERAATGIQLANKLFGDAVEIVAHEDQMKVRLRLGPLKIQKSIRPQ